MKILGLCGGSGSGKGTVAKIFLEFGIPGIDTDALYHELTENKTPCLTALTEEFGDKILTPDGILDRAVLADIVFSSSEKRERLNKIAHKFILKRAREIIKEYEKTGAYAVLIDAPLLFESGFDAECDSVIAVIADKSLRIARIMDRDGISEDRAIARINSQIPDSVLTSKSDFVIDNSSSLEHLYKSVSEIVIKIKNN